MAETQHAVLHPKGTSFPGSPASGDFFYRTDLNLEFFWNGTRWLTTHLYIQPLETQRGFNVMSAGTTWDSPRYQDLGLWMEKFMVSMHVLTTNDGTRYWTGTCEGVVLSTQGLAANVTHVLQADLNTASAPDGNPTGVTWTKVSTPGSLVGTAIIAYRLIGE